MSEIPEAADSSRYDQAAASYNYGRLQYDARLLDHAIRLARLGPDSTVLDLGCGPGTIANQIAAHCGHVIAVDPSEEMLEAGRAHAPANVTYVKGSSADLSFIDQPLSLVTFGRSFHWMDRDATLAALDRLVLPGGCLAMLYVGPMPRGRSLLEQHDLFGEHAWWRAVVRTADALAVGNPNEVLPPSTGKEREEVILLRSAFSEVSFHGHISQFDWTLDRLVAWVQSRYATSSGTQQTSREMVESALRKALEPHGPGPWRTWNQQRVILARRPG